MFLFGELFHSAIILPVWLNYVHLPAAPSLVFVSIDGIDERHLSYLGDYVEGWNSCEMYSMRDMTLLCLFMHECILDHMHGRIQLRETKTMEKISSFGWKWLFSSASLEWSCGVSTSTILVINRMCSCGKPLFWNSVTCTYAATSPKYFFFINKSLTERNLARYTLDTRSGRSWGVWPGSRLLVTSSQ